MHIFKNVLLAIRKPDGRINHKLVQQAKIRPKPVTMVIDPLTNLNWLLWS
jgi:hypothetical protein